MQYHLVTSIGSEAPKSCINPDDEILTVLGGKASCRRKFVINVHLMDDHNNIVANSEHELSVMATVAYAHDCSPIVQDHDNLFLAEPPLLTTFNGVEYPSQDRPTRLVAGKASFKLAISLLSSKYDNRLFCICFIPQFTSTGNGAAMNKTMANGSKIVMPLCDPCYSKPIRSISRKRSTPASGSCLSHHHYHHHHHHRHGINPSPPLLNNSNDNPATDHGLNSTLQENQLANSSHPPLMLLNHPPTFNSSKQRKSNSPDAVTAAEHAEVDKFFRASVTTPGGSCDEEADVDHLQLQDNAISMIISGKMMNGPSTPAELEHLDSGENSPQTDGSLRYISSNDYKQEAHLLPRESMSYGSANDDPGGSTMLISDNHPVAAACTRALDPLSQNFHPQHGSLVTVMDGLSHSFIIGGNTPGMGAGKLFVGDVLQNGLFSPHAQLISRSESTSPISGILCTSDGSMEHEAFSQTSPLAPLLQRPLSAPHSGSQLSSPFRPYVSSRSGTTVDPFHRIGNSTARVGSPPYALRRNINSPVNIEASKLVDDVSPSNDNASPYQHTTTSVQQAGYHGGNSEARCKQSLDAVLQKFLAEAASCNCGMHSSGGGVLRCANSAAPSSTAYQCAINSSNDDDDFEDEEQSLLSLEIALQQAIREVEKKKEDLRNKRQRLQLVEDEARLHNIVFQSSSWVESLSNKFNQ